MLEKKQKLQKEMASWNSIPLQVTYQILGWLTFISWGIAGFPQIILNFHRKSVVGLNLDFELLNLTKFLCYLIYNASLYFSSAIQKQYFEKYGYGQMIPVAANDVAFSAYALVMTSLVLCQIAIYQRGGQKFSKYAIGLVSLVLLCSVICFLIALPNQSWLWFISILNSIQVCLTVIKYFPQAFMNFLRKSTDGFSIGGVLLDFSGGVFNYSQMVVQSIDQGSWMNFYGNIGKVMISLVTLFYDSVLMFQHYVLYRGKKAVVSHKDNKKMREPLICHSPNDVTDQLIKGSEKCCDQPPAVAEV